MPKKRERAGAFADVVAAMGPAPEAESVGSYVPSPLMARGFTDADGRHWRLARGPLDPRRAKRLAVSADMMSMGDHYDDRVGWWLPRFLTEAERPGAWLEARARFDATDPPVHAAYEFTTDDGLVLLYIATDC
ncbi:hypothetical protein [Kitasatospora sp. NPDC048538]|uniref:hypothetical protein n=1 Tax=unclassified Kitasatospora TaxID=2633591 RepID=UPI0033EBE9A1